ncbi:MAG: hypothetical protein PHN80_12425 [Hespellia sp.]|nr:hypothetical protein [Hespellia sp.]
MEEIKSFFADNSAQIWTLFSVVVGGVVTYISTAASEKRKNKRQAQKEKLEQVLVPYCTCLEKTTLITEAIYEAPINCHSQKIISEFISSLKKPLEYLEAAKRVYLSKTMRAKLQTYKTTVNNFENQLQQECTDCLIKYKHYISCKLEPFPNLPASMEILFSMDKSTEEKVKIAILTKHDISLINNFTCIDFVKNDDPDNYRHTSITLNDEIRNTWGAIKYGVMDSSDITNTEEELACILLDYIDENITDEKNVLATIIDETVCAAVLSGIRELLNEMTRELVKTIDKITN